MKSFFRALRNDLAPDLIDCPKCNHVFNSNLKNGIFIYIFEESLTQCPKCKTNFHCTRIHKYISIYKASEALPIETKIVGEVLFFILNKQSTILQAQYDKYKHEIIKLDNLNLKQQEQFQETETYFSQKRFIDDIIKQIEYTRKILPNFDEYWSVRINLINAISIIHPSADQEQEKALNKLANHFNNFGNKKGANSLTMNTVIDFKFKGSMERVTLADLYDEDTHGNHEDFFGFVQAWIITGRASIVGKGDYNFVADYDNRGFNSYGIHRNGSKYDNNGFNYLGFNKDGYDKNGYNKLGYDKYGYHKTGYNRFGYDKNGFNRSGIHRNGTKYNSKGLDVNGNPKNTTISKSNTYNQDYKYNETSKENNTSSRKHILKLVDIDTADDFTKLIIKASDFANKPLQSNIAKHRAALRNILNTKLQRVNYNQDDYIKSLITNVVFYQNELGIIKNEFSNCLRDGIVLNENELNRLIAIAQEECKLPNYKYDAEDIKNINAYHNIFPVSKRIESLEFDYMYYNTYAEILFELLAYLTNAPNKSILLTKNHNEVLSLIDNYVRLSTSDILGNLKMK